MNRFLGFILLCLLAGCCWTAANVALIGNNVSFSFDDVEANFAPAVKDSGECGLLYLAEPLDACSLLTSEVNRDLNTSSPFVLIIRGGCSFEDKVRRAQKAGFKAAIIYDNEEGGLLVAMAGNSAGIRIHAVFVSKSSGEILKNYAYFSNKMDLWITPSFESTAWSIMAMAFISLLAMSATLAICFFVRRHHLRQEHPRATHIRQFHGMSSHLVKAMPSSIFTSVLDDRCTSTTCAICLEDYTAGEKLRILPCCHKFHASCVDSWLTTWRTFCPVCKRDARTSSGDPPASESTPLMLYSSGSLGSSSVLSSARSSLLSSAIQIVPAFPQSLLLSQNQSLSDTPYTQNSFISYRHSPSSSVSRSSIDLRNASSRRTYASNLVPPYSSGHPSISPLHSGFWSQNFNSPSNASSSFIGSSGHQHNPLRLSESAASFSPFSSAQSLPEC